MAAAGEMRLERMIDILIALGAPESTDAGGLGVVRIARIVGGGSQQVSRALRALDHSGLVERDEATREYRLGWRLFTLAARGADQRLLALAPPVLHDLLARARRDGAPQRPRRRRGRDAADGVVAERRAGDRVDRPRGPGALHLGGPRAAARPRRALAARPARRRRASRPPGPARRATSASSPEGSPRPARSATPRSTASSRTATSASPRPSATSRGRIVAALERSAPAFRLGGRGLDAAGREIRARADELSARLGSGAPTTEGGPTDG